MEFFAIFGTVSLVLHTEKIIFSNQIVAVYSKIKTLDVDEQATCRLDPLL